MQQRIPEQPQCGQRQKTRKNLSMSELNQATRLVLVIDDDEAIRMAICDILQTVGIQVVMAAGGEDGLELYQQRRHEVDLILLDYSMPGLDGAA